MCVNANYLHAYVEDTLFRHLDSPLFARRVAERRETGTRRAELIAEKDGLAKRREVLRRAMLSGDYDDDLEGYRQDVRELGIRIGLVESELAMSQPVNPAEEWTSKGAALREAWQGFDDDEKRAIIKDALGYITVSRATRRGPGFDPKRIEFGINTDAR
jgi:hypothetical protein